MTSISKEVHASRPGYQPPSSEGVSLKGETDGVLSATPMVKQESAFLAATLSKTLTDTQN